MLARHKSFSQLTDAEQALVLDAMPAETYQQLRRMLLMAPAMDTDVQPPARLRANLLQQFTQPVPRPSLLQRCIQARLPVWQAAAVLLLTLGVAGFVTKESPEKPQIITRTIVRLDTVFQDRVVWRERVVIRYRTNAQPLAAIPAPLIERDSNPPLIRYNNWTAYLTDTTSGNSLDQQPELLQFFTQPGSEK